MTNTDTSPQTTTSTPTTPRTADGKVDFVALGRLCATLEIPTQIKARGRICRIAGIEGDSVIYHAHPARQITRRAQHRPVTVQLSLAEAQAQRCPMAVRLRLAEAQAQR